MNVERSMVKGERRVMREVEGGGAVAANVADVDEVARGKVLVFTAPSGAGKTTLVRHLLGRMPDRLAFSVSATTRSPRPGERDGVDYYFLSADDFDGLIARDGFVEYMQLYSGQRSGTLRSEVERIWGQGKAVLFDVDVHGAHAIRRAYGDAARVVFVAPPSPEVLFARLRARGTEDEGKLAERIARAAEELNHRDLFDLVLVNDDLDHAKTNAERIAREWLDDAKPEVLP